MSFSGPIAHDVMGFNSLFYGQPKFQKGEWHWGKKGLLSKEFKYTNIQQPAPHFFNGEVYLLTDGLCLSSCADFVAVMQQNGKANIIGEETGGGFQGNTSGLIPSETLPIGLVVDVPLLKYHNAVSHTLNIGHGTMPDQEIRPSFTEFIYGDAYVKRVITQIRIK